MTRYDVEFFSEPTQEWRTESSWPTEDTAMDRLHWIEEQPPVVMRHRWRVVHVFEAKEIIAYAMEPE